MESFVFFSHAGQTYSWWLKQTANQKLLTAVGARWSFPSRMTRAACEIMFHVMALRAKSGYVLQQLNGFSRMCGSRKKKQWWAWGVYQLHVRGEVEWFFRLSHPPSLLTAVDLQARSPLYQRVLCLAAATLPRSAFSYLDHFGGKKRRLSCTLWLFCNRRQQFYFSCPTCQGCVNENFVACKVAEYAKKKKKDSRIFFWHNRAASVTSRRVVPKSVFQVFGSNSWELFFPVSFGEPTCSFPCEPCGVRWGLRVCFVLFQLGNCWLICFSSLREH